ncbi:hypothetical protein CPB86DRAFT_497179 [Serendipita vermifera]|nr:hypothetical protein CPB86DRAFT_497179 [Serendipita vermifera]
MRDLTPITSRFPSLTSSRSLSSTDCSALGIPETNTALSQCQTPRFQRYEYFDPSLSNEIHLCDDNPNGLQEYLFQLQAQILQLRREKEDLQAQLLEVRNQIEPQNFSADRIDDSDGNKSNAVNDKYKILMSRFAKNFAFGTCLFLPFRVQLKDTISLPEGYDPGTRFISLPGESKEDKSSRLKFGTYWELFDALPASMKENAKDPRFLKAMVRAMQSFRSHFQYDIRSRPLELLEEFTHLMATNDLKKFSDPEFRASNAWCRMLSGYNETVPDGNPHYPDFPPIICKEVEPGQDPIEGLFRTDIIRKILIIVLFGPGQLRKEQFTRPEICNATHWNITEITPGMIASAAVGARYLVSPDKSFTPVGPQSKINWQETFHTYKQFLSTRRNDPPIARLFSDFNMELIDYDSGEYTVSGPNNHGVALEQTTTSVPDPITDSSQEEGIPGDIKIEQS